MTHSDLVISLSDSAGCQGEKVGGKGEKLARLMASGFNVPAGFCLTVDAYRLFVREADIEAEIRVELGRKPLADMRWEEIWDTALRIRSAFLRSAIPDSISEALLHHLKRLNSQAPLAVRSSSGAEDSAGASFAGLHESIVDVSGFDQLTDAIRIVWASLWSDAALLYRKEMNLDPARSAMAAVIQEFRPGGPSGVAFTRDPRDTDLDQSIVEAVPGANSELVDGLLEPDRWIISRSSRQVIRFDQGARPDSKGKGPLVSADDLTHLYDRILAVESSFGWAADIEWTGRGPDLTILQARPITSGTAQSEDDRRQWYLSLRPKLNELKMLAARVSQDLLPRLEREAEEMAGRSADKADDRELAKIIKERLNAVKNWRRTYYDEFIPLAHGVRQLGIYYNNEVKPANPYEFMTLLGGQDLIAFRRNQLIDHLARTVRQDQDLKSALTDLLTQPDSTLPDNWRPTLEQVGNPGSMQEFLKSLDHLMTGFSQVSFEGETLAGHPEIYLSTVLQLSEKPPLAEQTTTRETDPVTTRDIENRLMNAVGSDRHEEARQVIELGRLSWKLRDDDNILIGRLESLLLEALNNAGQRLIARGCLDQYERLSDGAALILADALLYPPEEPLNLTDPDAAHPSPQKTDQLRPRQLVGQPAGPGFATGPARRVTGLDDLRQFRRGEVLICDAIQPTMTHVVPLAAAIVERRGGMLIHGAIIARELGIPCVNGVADAADLIATGEKVAVDGYLGIVTVGEPELDLEKKARTSN